MQRMGALSSFTRTEAEPGHKIYPYLLRGLAITRPNQVWAMDITRAREQQLGHFNQANPVGLVYPVRYADGDHFHVESEANAL
jgi:hypothetical protein